MHIYGRHTSYNVQKILWLADEMQLTYQHTELGGAYGGLDDPSFKAMNPMGKVPVLEDNGNIIWESNSILRYLTQQHGVGIWAPGDAYQQSLSNRWLDWSIEHLDKAFVGVFWGYYRTPPHLRDNNAIARSVGNTERCLQALSKQLGVQSNLLGETLSIADIGTAVFLHRLISIDLDIKFPANILNWYFQLSERPGYTQWVMSDYSSLKHRTKN